MKRKSLVVALLLMSFSFVLGNGFTSNLARGSYGIPELIIAGLGPFFGALLGSGSGYLFEKVLLFLIITSIVYMVISRMDLFSSNNAIVIIITFAVSILSTRLILFDEFLFSIFIPYSVLGFVLTAFLPLLIGFFFTQQFDSGVLRKIFWIFFTVIFFAMWDFYYYDAGSAGWVYLISAVISLFFFLFDGTIRRAMINESVKQTGVKSAENLALKITKELHQLNYDISQGVYDENNRMVKARKKSLLKQLKNIAKN